MADILKITQLIEDNLFIINNINHISKEHIRATMNNIVKYSNYLYTNNIKKELQSFRYRILVNYEVDESKWLFRIFLYFLIHKYADYFQNVAYTKEIYDFFINLIDNYEHIIVTKPFVQIANKSGLDFTEMNKLLDHLCNIRLTKTTKNIDQIIDEMYYIEDGNSKYGLFRYSVVGNNNCSHSNMFLYDRYNNRWIRIEPAGIYFCDDNDPAFVKNQYNDIDTKIKELKSNYLSFNQYHYLPGFHFINPGPYCAYYSIMVVEEYINNPGNIFSIIEKISSLDYINKKLKQYELILQS
jgi:hypothetical protein